MSAGVGPVSGMKTNDIVLSKEGEYGIIIDKVQDSSGRLVAQVQLLNRTGVKSWTAREMLARWRSSKRPA